MLRNYSERLHGREATRPDVTYTFGGAVVETTVEMPELENDPTKPREPKPDYSSVQVGMYYYDDGTFGTEPENKRIVGVVVIPAAATPDGYVRIAPMSGWSNSVAWSNITDIDDLKAAGVTTVVRSYPNTVKDGTIYESTQSIYQNILGENEVLFPYFYMEIPDEIVDKFNDDVVIKQSTLNPSLAVAYISDDDSGVLPVPYLQDGTINPDFVVEGTITADWTSADENMAALKEADSDNIFKCADKFSYGIGAGNWHVPTITELLFMYAKMKTIANAYTAAGFDNPFYKLTSDSSNFDGAVYLQSSSFIGQFDISVTDCNALRCVIEPDAGGYTEKFDIVDRYTSQFMVPLATITPDTKVTEPLEILEPEGPTR